MNSLEYDLHNYLNSLESEFVFCEWCSNEFELTESNYNELNNTALCPCCGSSMPLD